MSMLGYIKAVSKANGYEVVSRLHCKYKLEMG
jgi:hypothetical protein